MKNLLLVISVTVFTVVGFTQSTKQQQTAPQTVDSQIIFPEIPNFNGSFQFQIVKNPTTKRSTKLAINSGLLDMIETRRLENEDLELELAHDITLVILSKSKISVSGFTGYQVPYIIK